MLDYLITLLPCSTCIILGCLLFTRRGRSQIRESLTWLAVMAGAFFLLDAYAVSPATDYRTVVVVEILSAFIAPAVFPTIIYLIRKMENKDFSSTGITLLFTPSVLIGSTVLIIYMTLGLKSSAAYLEAFDLADGHPEGWTDSIYRLRDFVCIHIVNLSSFAWILATLICCILFMIKKRYRPSDLFDFYFKDKPVDTFHIIVVSVIFELILIILRTSLGSEFIRDHIYARWAISMMMTAGIYNMLFTGYRFDGALIDIKHFRNTSLIDQELKAFRESQQNKAKASAGIVGNEETLIRLRDLFVEYMDIEKPYLDPEMTLDDAASALSTNRTYLSSMLKRIMGVTFKSYINERRVQEVKEKLMTSPGSNLSEIADVTGFASDSQLIKKFSELVGESPRTWAKKQKRNGTTGQ